MQLDHSPAASTFPASSSQPASELDADERDSLSTAPTSTRSAPTGSSLPPTPTFQQPGPSIPVAIRVPVVPSHFLLPVKLYGRQVTVAVSLIPRAPHIAAKSQLVLHTRDLEASLSHDIPPATPGHRPHKRPVCMLDFFVAALCMIGYPLGPAVEPLRDWRPDSAVRIPLDGELERYYPDIVEFFLAREAIGRQQQRATDLAEDHPFKQQITGPAGPVAPQISNHNIFAGQYSFNLFVRRPLTEAEKIACDLAVARGQPFRLPPLRKIIGPRMREERPDILPADLLPFLFTPFRYDDPNRDNIILPAQYIIPEPPTLTIELDDEEANRLFPTILPAAAYGTNAYSDTRVVRTLPGSRRPFEGRTQTWDNHHPPSIPPRAGGAREACRDQM